MKKTIKILKEFPEYYLVLLMLLAGYIPPLTINPICLIIALFLVFQIIYKNVFSGFILTAIFLIANIYFLGALISEFNEFKVFNHDSKQLLFVGLSIFCFNIFVIAVMIYNYSISTKRQSLNALQSKKA